MKILLFITGFILSLNIQNSFSQDMIVLRTGEVIKTKVIVIGTKDVRYKMFDNPTGPDYILLKKDISSITLESGYKEEYMGNLNQFENKKLCHKKIKKYSTQKKTGFIIIGASILGLASLGIFHYNHEDELVDEDYLYLFGSYYIAGTLTGLGIFLSINGYNKEKKYTKKLEMYP